MGNSIKGRVLIINIKTSDTDRPGSEKDYKNLCQLLNDLGFKIATTKWKHTEWTDQVNCSR